MKLLLTLMFTLACAACTTLPKVPEQVPVTVTKFRPLPAWATTVVPRSRRTDTRVQAHLDNEEQLEGVTSIYECRTKLLAQLDRGEKVDGDTCEKSE
jgi:hypothetical protein